MTKFSITLATAAMAAALAPAALAAAADAPDRGIDLFDGESLAGWENHLVEPDEIWAGLRALAYRMQADHSNVLMSAFCSPTR